MKLFVVQKMPDPRDDGLSRSAGAMGRAFCRGNRGSRFCSFHQLPRNAATRRRDGRLFSREQDESARARDRVRRASRLLEQFKTTPRSVLFGTDSFWMGVDVPGEALSNVIITRLAFRRSGSSADRSETGAGPGTRRRSIHRIFVAGGSLEIRQGVGRSDSDEERHGHRGHSR